MKSADVVQLFNTIGLGATVDVIPGHLPETVQQTSPGVASQVATGPVVGPPGPVVGQPAPTRVR
jgi:hypothetical protein